MYSIGSDQGGKLRRFLHIKGVRLSRLQNAFATDCVKFAVYFWLLLVRCIFVASICCGDFVFGPEFVIYVYM